MANIIEIAFQINFLVCLCFFYDIFVGNLFRVVQLTISHHGLIGQSCHTIWKLPISTILDYLLGYF